ncbi:MAG: hypothetical protein QGI75_06950 [Phycisphaerales bacterium]|nr:hypothetical protein [Phycisphaerales bacterium]
MPNCCELLDTHRSWNCWTPTDRELLDTHRSGLTCWNRIAGHPPITNCRTPTDQASRAGIAWNCWAPTDRELLDTHRCELLDTHRSGLTHAQRRFLGELMAVQSGSPDRASRTPSGGFSVS